MSLTTFLKKLSPGRIIALGFLFCILLGSLLLMLPCSLQPGIALPYLDALYTATSAVCVTGLNVIDPGSTFSPFGQFVLGCLIQIGGLGVASIGVGIMLAMGKKINLKERRVIRDAMNLDSGKGLIRFVKAIFCTTLLIELLGAFLSFPVFFRDYPLPRAIGLSLFHSVASLNNSGFDVLGNGTSLIPYQKDVLLNLVTCALVIAGGIGFPVIFELPLKHFSWKRQSMHTRVVLSTTFALLLFGTLLLKLTESISWLGAFFYSVSARTAGFSTYNLSDFSTAGLLVVSGLMFIGASPASTGGGIKTTTFFVLLSGIYSGVSRGLVHGAGRCLRYGCRGARAEARRYGYRYVLRPRRQELCRCPADAGPRHAVFLRYPPAPSRPYRARRRAAGHLHSGDASAGCLAARARMAQRDGRRAGRCTVLRTRRHSEKTGYSLSRALGGAARPAARHSCAAGGICPPRRRAALQHLHDPAPGKRGCGGGLPAHASGLRPGKRAVARGLRHRAGSDGHAASGAA